MRRCLIVYFSQTGSTARAGELVAAGMRASGFEVKLCNIKDEKPPDVHSYDMLGIGFPAYGFNPPFNVSDYVNGLGHLEGMPAFALVTYGTYRFNAANSVRQALVRKGAKEVGYFCCRGADFYLQYLKRGYFFSPDHPTAEELDKAEAFGREIVARVDGGQYLCAAKERAPSVIYRLEQLFYGSGWLARFQTRLFKVDRQKCNLCGLCAARCPVGNISQNQAGYPRWGRYCLMCLTCEMECSEDAITSVQGWSAIRPFVTYNVQKASQDPSISHVRVNHQHGRTTRI